MAYQIKQKQGRPRSAYKVRTIKGFTPKGFRFHEIKGKSIVFKRRVKGGQ